VVKGLEDALVGPGVLGGVETDLGSGVGAGLLETRDAEEVGVPRRGADGDGGRAVEGGARGKGLGGLRKGRVEAGLRASVHRSSELPPSPRL
jgi:hypothetical protein